MGGNYDLAGMWRGECAMYNENVQFAMKKCNVQWKSAMCNEMCAICNGKVQWAMKFVQSAMKQCNVQ